MAILAFLAITRSFCWTAGPSNFLSELKLLLYELFSYFVLCRNRLKRRFLGKQLLRSGASVAANYRAGCRSRSRAEFVSKIGVVVEEADESAFWIELLADAGIMKKERLAELLKEA